MHTTSINRTLALAGLAPAGKLSPTYGGLLPVLALFGATAAWGQTAPIFRGHLLPPNISMAAPSPKPAADTPASAHYKFITIGPKDSPYAVANGIDNAGLVSGYYQDASSNYHAFVWQNGTFKTVDYPGAVDTLLFGISNRGVAIGYYGDGTTNHTVTYSVRTGAWTPLPDIPNYSQNDGYCVNDAGMAVGNAFEGSTAVAWIWDPATLSYSFFAVPGAAEYTTSPSCINDKNQVAGYFADANGMYHGFLKEYDTYTTIDVPGATETFPDGINNLGTIEGQWDNADYTAQGFLITSAGHFVNLDHPGPEMTAIVGINDRGDVCGGYWEGPNPTNVKAFIALPK
jgi:probable HAF family extracellular repeat protein